MPRLKKTDEYVVQAYNLFKRKGLMLSMEQIAAELNLTKKTLYNNFANRDDLIRASAQHFFTILEDIIRKEIENSKDAISEMLTVSHLISKQMSGLGDLLLKDVSVYRHKMHLFNHKDRKSIYSSIIRANLERGLREGLYRESIDIDRVALFYTSSVDTFYYWDGEYKFICDYKEYFTKLVKYHLYSVTNDKGRIVLGGLYKDNGIDL